MRILSIFLLFGCGLATADTFLIKTTDGGRSWTDIDPGPPHQLLAWLKVDPRTSALYALTRRDFGAEGRLLISANGGRTWQTRQSFPQAVSWNILVAGPVSPDTFYLAYEELGVPPQKSVMIAKLTGESMEQYRAEGLTFDRPPPGSFSGYLVDLAVAPAAPSKLYALVTNELNDDINVFFQALWVSVDGGRNWRRLQPPETANCLYPQIWVGSSDSSVYLACGSDFLKSTDGGESWTRKPAPDGERIWNLLIGPGAPAILYNTRGSGIWKSTDGAETWQRSGNVPNGALFFALHPTNPSVIFGTARDGIMKSEDGGETWTTLLTTLFEHAFGIQVDPRAPDTLYAVSFQRQEPRLHDRQTFLRNLLGEKQVAPGSLVSIYGRDLATETRVAGSTPLPVSLGGASVFFNGQPAPLLFVSPGQINAQVPFGLAAVTGVFPPTTSATMEVRRADASMDRQTVSLSPRAVVILRENPTRQSAPLLFHASDFRRVSADDPARRGEAITLFALGMGELEPSIASGELPPTPAPQLANPPCVIFSGVLAGAPSLWAGAAPGLIGVYQVNLEIPASLSPGAYTLSLTDRRVGDIYGRECRIGYEGNQLDSFTLEVQ